MKTPIKVLQIGLPTWTVPDQYQTLLIWTQSEASQLSELLAEETEDAYDMIIIDEALSDEQFELLSSFSKPYRVWLNEILQETFSEAGRIYEKRFCPKWLNFDDKEPLYHCLVHSYFTRPYGEKLHMTELFINERWVHEKTFYGNNALKLACRRMEDYQQVGGWKRTIFKDPNRNLEFWLEYQADPNVSILLQVYEWDYHRNLLQTLTLDPQQGKPLMVESKQYGNGTYWSINLLVKGQGDLYVGALHWRHSLENKFFFIPGGQRFVAENRDEFFYYFSPGNLKPPLNVYFSGYRTQEGFEGYFMMKNLDHPFLLFADPRIEGGAFYVGNEDYEEAIMETITRYLKELGFQSSELIMSGLSMGTYAALYYGCQLKPHSIIMGKPLVHIGLIADRIPLERPNDFFTILDVIQRNQIWVEQAVDKDTLNNRLLSKLKTADFNRTIMAIAYMLDDDYDNQAFSTLYTYFSEKGTHLISKALEGRHNDNSAGIFSWFISQYRRILATDFQEVKHDA